MAKAVARRGIQTTSWRTILLLVETGLSDINLNSTPEGAGCKEEIPLEGVRGRVYWVWVWVWVWELGIGGEEKGKLDKHELRI